MRFAPWMDFEIERDADWVEVTDKDGTMLWDSSNAKFWEMRYAEFVSNTNLVEVRFKTDGSVTERGWRLLWGEFERNLDCTYFTQSNYQEWSETRSTFQRVGS